MKREPTERIWADCAYSGCIHKAIIRKNNSNLCLEHYEEQHLCMALKWNHDHGLETVADRQRYAFETPFKFKTVT